MGREWTGMAWNGLRLTARKYCHAENSGASALSLDLQDAGPDVQREMLRFGSASNGIGRAAHDDASNILWESSYPKLSRVRPLSPLARCWVRHVFGHFGLQTAEHSAVLYSRHWCKYKYIALNLKLSDRHTRSAGAAKPHVIGTATSIRPDSRAVLT